jgi:2-keto-4-pentenoate hydratase
MSAFDPHPAAAALIAARDARQPVRPLAPEITPRNESDAALVQFEVWNLRGGHAIGGFKIGATGRRMQQYLDIDHPCAGFMARADLHPSGAKLPFAAFRNLAVECELAVRLAADLPGPATLEQAGAAVGELCAAIEIVENRYGAPPVGDVKAIGTPTLIADQFYHAAAVLGPPTADWRAFDLVAIEGRALVDGIEKNAGRGEELLGHPLRGLAWLAGSAVAAAFGGLRAGQVVMLGSVTPPVWLEGPCRVEMRFDGLAPVAVEFA